MVSSESERGKRLLGLAVKFCIALLFLLLLQPAQTLASTGTVNADVTSSSTLTTDQATGDTLTTGPTVTSTQTIVQSVNSTGSTPTGGAITGTVTDTAGVPISGANVNVYDINYNQVAYETTDTNGNYSIAGLAAGNYFVEASASGLGYLSDTYNGTVSVTDGQTVTGVDFTLQIGATISGVVTDANGNPLQGVQVGYGNGWEGGYTYTDVDGSYSFGGIAPGSYKVYFDPSNLNKQAGTNYLEQYYNNQSSYTLANYVVVSAGENVSDINAALQTASTATGSISGTVTDVNGVPVPGAVVDVYDTNNNRVTEITADPYGTFAIPSIAPGTYKLQFTAFDGTGYVSQWYNNQPDFSSATPVTVNPGGTVSIAAVLQIGGTASQGPSISGVVTDTNGNPVQNLHVTAYGQTTGYAFTSYTGPDGSYTFDGLDPDNYVVEFNPYSLNQQSGTSYLDQYYNNQQSYGDADRVTVGNQQSVTGIDAVLQIGGSISGIVTGPDGKPVSNVVVTASGSAGGDHNGTAVTAADGSYKIVGLAADSYIVAFDTRNVNAQAGTNYAWQCYANQVSYTQANRVNVTSGQTVSNINAQLQVGGSISGTVTLPDGSPAAGVIANANGTDVSVSATTQADGSYVIAGLLPGIYTVSFDPGSYNWQNGTYYLASYYNNQANVSVTQGQNTSGIDTQLQEAGKISGTVTLPDGSSAVGVTVIATSSNSGMSAVTQADGSYVISQLASGNYTVQFDPASYNLLNGTDYIAFYYKNQADVAVTQGQTTAGIDAQLNLGGRITGAITDNMGQPVAGISVDVYDLNYHWVGGATSDVDGTYKVTGIAAGTYKLAFDAYNGLNYLNQWYQNQSDFNSADSVVVNQGQILQINAVMQTGGTISGVVTDASGQPVQNVYVTANGSTGGNNGYAYTGIDGRYTIVGLFPDSYVVEFNPSNSNQYNGTNYMVQYYNNQLYSNTANKLTVGDSQDVTGINAVLQTGGSISGVVTGPDGKPVQDVYVSVGSSTSGSYGYAYTGGDGSYTIVGLVPGDYVVEFDATNSNHENGTNYAFQYYANQSSQSTANKVKVALSQAVSNINAVLEPGSIISGIVTDINGNPLPNVNVNVSGEFYAYATTDANGKYTVTGLAPGTYTIQFDPSSLNAQEGTNYLSQYYPNQLDQGWVSQLTVGEAQTFDNIDAKLILGGAVSGTVKDSNGNPLSNIYVYVDIPNGSYTSHSGGYTDADGNYTITGLIPGAYEVFFGANGPYISQYYNGKDYNTYDPVSVVQGQTTANIDATLQAGGSISGTVTDLNGNPVTGLRVRALDQNGNSAWSQTSKDGTYTLEGLSTGSYTVVFGDSWNNQDDNLNYLISQTPNPIQVIQGQAITGIDARLAPGGSIAGTVTDASGNTLADVYVNVEGQTTGYQTHTDSNGHYQVVGLAAGKYKVMFNGYGLGYPDQWYNNTTKDLATEIQVTPGQDVTNINAQFAPGGTITGTVTDSNGKPIAEIEVDVYSAGDEHDFIGSIATDGDGNYAISGLATGNYKVLFGSNGAYNPINFVQTWYGDQTDFTNASVVVVKAGLSTGNINAQLLTGGTISGTVTDYNGQPVADLEVQAYNAQADYNAGNPSSGYSDNSVAYTYTDSNGHYSLVGLAEGSYKLKFVVHHFNDTEPNYAFQWSGGQATFDQATAVSVVPGQNITTIDAQMQEGGSISGTIVDANGTPIANAIVGVYDDKGNYTWYTTYSDGYGHYQIGCLPTGNYKVLFQFTGYKQSYDQWYSNKATMSDATLVPVTVGKDSPNVNAQLMSGGIISGRIIDAANNPVSNVTVQAYDQNGHYGGSGYTDDFGNYTMVLPTGTYQLKVDTAEYTDYMIATSNYLTVANGQTLNNVNLELIEGTRISGKVYGNANNTMSGVEIDVFDTNNNLVAKTETDYGQYYLNLQPGTYKIQAKVADYNYLHGTNYSDEWYNNQAPIVVVQGQPQTGLNISLTSTDPVTTAKGTLDNPAPNQELTGVINVSGWFLDQTGVAKLEVLVDNQVVGQAVYGDPRPDVAAAFPDYNNPNAGFHYSLDTTAFADGIHTLTLRETSANGQVTTLPVVTFTSHNLPAKAALDTPASGAALSGKADVSGWLIDGVGVSKVEVLIDGNVVGEATYGDPRPDVAAAFPEYNNPDAGFHYNLDTSSLSVGNHTLTIRETALDGSQKIVATQAIIVAAAAKGNLDDLSDGATVSGNLNIHGWYLDQAGVDRIQVLVDGNVVGEATYGDERPDVYAAYPEYNNPNSGFHYDLDTTSLSPGSHTLSIREIAKDGSQRDLPAKTINVSIQDKGFLDGVDNGATLSGTVNLSGWYLSKTGVTKIEVLVDGNVVGIASYGDSRPDVYAAFPDYDNQNSGYHFSLNTGSLTAGSHTLTLRETGADGSTHDFAVRSFSVTAARKGTIDNLDDGASLSGDYNLYGWYLDTNGVAKIQILVDGNVVGEASYGDARPDVYAAFPDYSNQNAGYHYDLNTSGLSAGTHTLVVREISMDGSQNDLTARTFTTSLQPKGTIDGITDGMPVSGTYNVSGWFLDVNTVQKVEVLVDGQVVGTATYGDARPDVAAAFPAYNNSNSGFHYSLDTTLLSTGSHTITVRETSATGAIVTLPEHTIVVGQ